MHTTLDRFKFHNGIKFETPDLKFTNMKKKIFMMSAFLLAGLFFGSISFAQDTTTAGQDLKHAAKKTGKAVEKGAEKAADKTAQVASSTKAVIKDKVYEGKVGPGGHRVYIDKHAKFYYIDKKGKKNYVTEAELKDKS